MCQAGAVVAYWSLTQEMAGWQGFEPFYCNQIFLSLNSANSLKTFRKNSNISIVVIIHELLSYLPLQDLSIEKWKFRLTIPESIVALVYRCGIYLTVCTYNLSDQFTYITCNEFWRCRLFLENVHLSFLQILIFEVQYR